MLAPRLWLLPTAGSVGSVPGVPSIAHDGMIQPFEHRPALAAQLLTDTLGIRLPPWRHARTGSSDLTTLVPTEFRADLVIELWNGDRRVMGVIVEVQTDRDPRKRYSWPVYLVNLRAKLECPIVLLVVCPNRRVAAWCAEPIELGHPDLVLTPLVLGPHRVPVITDPGRAGELPELAMLSALTHGGTHPQRHQVLAALAEALRAVDSDRATMYHDVARAVLPAAARRYLEGLMSTSTYKYRSDFALKHISQGEARAVLRFLDARGIEVTEEARARITGCTNPDQLDLWASRAVTANSVDDLFDA